MIQYSNNKLLTGPSLDSRNHTEEIKRGEVGSIFNILTVERAKQYQDLAMQSRLRIPLIFWFGCCTWDEDHFPDTDG